ncbi:MAG: hypothetical protein M1546_23010, partial [Chloroflexi bacterium]|nr:hypothetical protein [Chloroflexota bacterium]
ISQFASQLAAHLGIKAGKWFIQQEQTRPPYQSFADRHTLSFTAAQLVQTPIQQAINVQQIANLVHTAPDHLRSDLSQPEGKLDILSRVEMRVQAEALEHHRDISHLGRHVVHQAIAEIDLTTGRSFQPCQYVQRGALATPGGSQEYQQLPIIYFQVQAFDGRLAGSEILGDVLKGNIAAG